MTPVFLSPEARRRQAIELRARYDAGASVEDLERTTGLSHGTVLNRLREAETVMRTPAQTRRLRADTQQVRLRQAVNARVRELYESGMSVKALAEQEGWSPRTVRRRLVEGGAVLRSAQQARRLAGREVAAARHARAGALRVRYEAGEDVPGLAAESGVSAATVYRLLHLAGARMRPQHRHRLRNAHAP
ncbi:hypothetical protein SAMN05216251_14014 [Actinacidiphila alni]|uniref:Helix-turn-helix domain-containing protein n=1 Tax=Actinacidiphila alni TaxID=380248 RepID=A0A1I2MNW2_9ACTN|nr:hypothetical protein [Actinacidiphila alni]SFF93245.1 hypothetical protein SAMN05216251_14014 [Actinacidiphila alni]